MKRLFLAVFFSCIVSAGLFAQLSVGYVQKQWQCKTYNETAKYQMWDDGNEWISGFQTGFRFESPSKTIGLSSGLFYEYYSSQSPLFTGTYIDSYGEYSYRMNFSEHSLYFPLHLRLSAGTPNFRVFASAGPSIDYGIASKVTAKEFGAKQPYFTETKVYDNPETGFAQKRFNASVDFGAGVYLYGATLRFGMSRGLINISGDPACRIWQDKSLMASLSWTFPERRDSYEEAKDWYDEPWRIFGLGFVSKRWEFAHDDDKYVEKVGFWENKKSIPGFRLGWEYRPLIGAGFGFATGLNLDFYRTKSDDYYDNGNFHMTFFEWNASIPLHVEYRVFLAYEFSIFFETGLSFDIGILNNVKIHSDDYGEDTVATGIFNSSGDWSYPFDRFCSYWDIGAGVRIFNFQLSVGTSRGLGYVELEDGWKARQHKNFSLGVSWYFE